MPHDYHIPNKLNDHVASDFNVWFERKVNNVLTTPWPLGNIDDANFDLIAEKLDIFSNIAGGISPASVYLCRVFSG